MGRVVHRQYDAGDDLQCQHERENAAECPPVIQIAWGRIGDERRMDEARDRQTPLKQFHIWALRLVGGLSAHFGTLQIWKTAVSRYGFCCSIRIRKVPKQDCSVPAPAGCVLTCR